MKDQSKTKQELIQELIQALSSLKQRIAELEQSESERKLVEEELMESEERFRLLLENSSDMIAIIDANGVERYVSESVEKVTGFPSKEIIGEDSFKFLHPDDIPKIAKSLQKLLTHPEKQIRREYRHRHKDGHWLHMEAIGTNYLNDPRIRGIIMNIREITERKKNEEALRQAEENFRCSFDDSPLGIRIVTEEGETIYANRAILDIYGYDKIEELKTTPIEKCYTPDSYVEFQIRRKKRRQGVDGPSEYTIDIIRKNGKIRHLQVFRKEIRWDGKKQSQVIYQDITARKRAEEALLESEKKYRLIFESAVEGILIVQGNQIKFANPALVKMVGYPEDIITTRPFVSFIHPEDRVMVLDRHERRTIGESVETGYTFRIISSDGTEKWLQINSRVISWEGAPATMSFLSDITARKRAEEALMESEKRYRELSITDSLTQLYNSRYFYHQLKMEIDRLNRYKGPLTILLVDFDNFKIFNDTYGHIEGDQVLLRFGQVVKRCLRQTDSAYRYGGEEFTIILPMTTSEEGAIIAERIRTEFKKENFSPVSGKCVYMTVSIGIASHKPQEDMKDFVNRVDQLMYQAKKTGRDRVCSES
jgi:diguanylate cyclase (GGDEF)-like protein/PAS domain S-box-containing protein